MFFTCARADISVNHFLGDPSGPTTSKVVHYFTQSLLFFLKSCPYRPNLFHGATVAMSGTSVPRLCLNATQDKLPLNLTSACCNAISFSYFVGNFH